MLFTHLSHKHKQHKWLNFKKNNYINDKWHNDIKITLSLWYNKITHHINHARRGANLIIYQMYNSWNGMSYDNVCLGL